ncbi:MAG: hypothetical protein E4H01_00185 [Lysobacterales bacterium]|nr:MAG: hypothetical protein E4H01_00185 [Xanthomonadales bacterium]
MSATVVYAGAVAETLSAVDSQVAVGNFVAAVAEVLGAADTVDGLISADAAVAETLTVVDTVDATVDYAASVAESLTALDTVGAQVDFAAAVAEILAATDTQDGTVPVLGATISTTGYQVIVNRDDTAAPLFLAVDNGGGVPGLTVTAKVRIGNGTDYLDFDDDTFKAAGWVQKTRTLTDIGGGHYTGALDIAAITNLPSTNHLSVEYAISGSVTAVAQAIMSFNLSKDTEVTNVNTLLSVIEGSYDIRQALRLLLAVSAGKVTGGGTGTERFRDVADSKDRVISVNDAQGNRTAITLDAG